jgi:hypothetical protein
MSKIEFLKNQIIETRNFIDRLISEIPQDLWYVIPDNTDSNFAWQIGHIMMAQNSHAITVITGRNNEVNDLIPIAEYNKIFNGMGSLHRSVEKNLILPMKLQQQLDSVYSICINGFDRLNDDDLNKPLEPIPFKHPIAETKYEAISWCFKHEMWHAAEMEAIKKDLGHPIKWI